MVRDRAHEPRSGLSAWGGATWIGGGDEDLILYSHYLPIFDLEYTLAIEEGSTRAGFVFGANDARLMDRNKNIDQLQAGRDESYIELELDVSAVNGTENGLARLNVYRVGYKDSDSKEAPFQTFAILPSVVNQSNKHAPHHVALTGLFGEISIRLDGNDSFARKPEGREEASGSAPSGGRREASPSTSTPWGAAATTSRSGCSATWASPRRLARRRPSGTWR